jgi:predicted MFS family arabinose efflux permease
VLRNRSLLGLIAAELVSLTGTAMTYLALPWFVLATTGSTAKTGWVLAAELLPVGLFGIPAGSVIARLGAKRTMLVSDAVRGPLMLVIPILHWTGHLSFAALLGTTFAVGVFATPYFSSSRLVVPEIAGEDERAVASVNAVLSGANQITQLAGPVLAGVLIAATSPATVLVVDAATFVASFLIIATVVRGGKRVEQTPESKGVLAGLRFLFHDSLLGPLMVCACGINMVAQALILALNALAYFQYDANAHVAGFLFGAFGVGALCGALAAQRLTQRVDLQRLAAFAIVAMPLPLFLLTVHLPWQAAMVAVAAFAFFAPIVNAPVFGIITVRTPAALRPKVLTAVMTTASIAGPLGFLAGGFVLAHVAVHTVFFVIALALTAGGLACAGVLLRERAAADVAAVPDVAHG